MRTTRATQRYSLSEKRKGRKKRRKNKKEEEEEEERRRCSCQWPSIKRNSDYLASPTSETDTSNHKFIFTQ